MNVYRKLLSLLPLLVLVASSHFAVAGQDSAVSQIKAEIGRLQNSLNEKPLTDKDLTELSSMVSGSLKAATDALNAGQTYLALEKLGQAEDLLQGARRAASKAEVEKGGYPAFESQWRTVSLRLNALEKDAHAKQWSHSPLAVRSLAEAAKAGPSLCSRADKDLPLLMARRRACSM